MRHGHTGHDSVRCTGKARAMRRFYAERYRPVVGSMPSLACNMLILLEIIFWQGDCFFPMEEVQ